MDVPMLVFLTVGAAGFMLVGALVARRSSKETSLEWERLFLQLPFGIAFCDTTLSLRRANPAFYEMFRLDTDSDKAVLLASNWLTPETNLEALLKRALAADGEIIGSIKLHDGEGCTVRVCRFAIGDTVLLSIVSQHTNRMESAWKDQQIVRIAHDLSSPLNAMSGWLHLIESSKIPGDEILPTIRRIQNDVRRQGGLIDELRKLVRPA